MTIRYDLGCDLNYYVIQPTTFVFNFEVAQITRHQDIYEQLTISPDAVRRTYVVPGSQNRYLSITAQPGPLNVHYEASVTLDVLRGDPSTICELELRDRKSVV